jgi:hypothetical protein
LYRIVFPKAMAAEINAFLYRANYGSIDFRFYSASQISETEKRIGLTRKRGSTTAYQALLPINIQKRWMFWNLPYPYGIANIRRADMIDLDECGVEVQSGDRCWGKARVGKRVNQAGPYTKDTKINLLGSSLSQTTVRHLQGNFGRGVDVTLPNGDSFNTRTITSNSGAHVRNNRIPGAGNAQPYPTTAPGMRSNLEPDYSCLSPNFVSASLNPTNLSNSVGLYMERMVDCDGGHLTRGGTNDVIDILDDDEDEECDGNAGRDGGQNRSMLAPRRRAMTYDDDGGGKMPAEDGGRGKRRVTDESTQCAGIALSQTSDESETVVRVRSHNIRETISKWGEWDEPTRRASAQLTKNLTKDYRSPNPQAKREYDPTTIGLLNVLKGMTDLNTPERTMHLRDHVKDSLPFSPVYLT